jgi:hypothetical protein
LVGATSKTLDTNTYRGRRWWRNAYPRPRQGRDSLDMSRNVSLMTQAVRVTGRDGSFPGALFLNEPARGQRSRASRSLASRSCSS